MYDSFAQLYDYFMRGVDYNAWCSYIVALFEKHGVRRGGAVYDAACGTGGITIRLAQAGYNVTGGDMSPAMLGFAADKARKAGLKLPFIRQDMRGIALHGLMDAVNCSCDGVNYLLSDKDVTAFFTSARAALHSGGLLCFDISSAHKLRSVLGGNCFGEDDGYAAYLWRNDYDESDGKLYMELSMFKRQGDMYARSFERHVQKAHEADHLLRLLGACGFDGACYGFGTFDPPGGDCERIAFAARAV